MDAIPDWLLIALGILADLAVLYGGFRLVRRFRRRRGVDSPRNDETEKP